MARHHTACRTRATASGRPRRPCASAHNSLNSGPHRTAKPTAVRACEKGASTPEINVTLLAHCENTQQRG